MNKTENAELLKTAYEAYKTSMLAILSVEPESSHRNESVSGAAALNRIRKHFAHVNFKPGEMAKNTAAARKAFAAAEKYIHGGTN